MTCYFHESKAHIHTCVMCEKNLCGECIHTEYPDYCWSCGLEYDNSLAEKVKIFEIPRFARGKVVQYILVKLAAAGGSWVGTSLLGCLFFGLHGLFFYSFLSIWVIYTYGMVCALIIDLMNRFLFQTSRGVTASIYFLLGMVFPWLVDTIQRHPFPIKNSTLMTFGAVAALLFFVIQQYKHRKEFIFVLAIISSVMPLIYFLLFLKGLGRLRI